MSYEDPWPPQNPHHGQPLPEPPPQSRLHKIARWLGGKAGAGLVGALVGALVTSTLAQSQVATAVDWVSWTVQHGDTSPTCDNPGYFRPLIPRKAEVSRAFNGINSIYGAQAVLDGDANTAWVSPDFPHKDRSDWIDFSMPTTSRIRLICIRNGFTQSVFSDFRDNGRVKTLSIVGCENGMPPVPMPNVDFEEKRSWEAYVPIAADCNTSDLKFIITESYPASNGDVSVAIADVKFYV